MAEKYQIQRMAYGIMKEMPDPSVQALSAWLGKVLQSVDSGEPIVWTEFTFWCELMVAMDLATIPPEAWPIAVMPALQAMGIDPGSLSSGNENPVLDAAEAWGLPPELCTAGRGILGGFLMETMPPPDMIVMPSFPCDNTRGIYQVMAKLTEAPMYVLDAPYFVDEEDAMGYWVNQYKGLITFLEEQSGKKMDYDHLREVVKETNRYCDYWMEGQELFKMKPLAQNGPFMGGEVLFSLGLPVATEAIKARYDAVKARVADRATAVPEEKVRVIWNYLPVLYAPTLFNWMAEELGAVTVVAMGSWEQHEPVDTSTPESIIRGMARRALNVHMGRQGRGASDVWIEDTLYAFEHWNGDCIIVNGALGCKWVRGSYGLLRDSCRERGIPVMMFDADIADARVVSQADVQARIGDFIESVVVR